jgi:3-oxoadipate enol-lactonase
LLIGCLITVQFLRRLTPYLAIARLLRITVYAVFSQQKRGIAVPTIAVNDITLAYAEYGPADGLPVILLHAFPLRGRMWDRQAQALSERLRCHVVVPDLRGSGDSDVPPGPYTMEQMASDVLSLADAQGFSRFVLGGLSMGGYIAFALLRQAAGRVRRLILADTRASADTEEGKANRESMAQQAEREGSSAIADVMLPNLLSNVTLNAPGHVAEIRAMIESNSPAGIAGTARGLALRRDAADLLPAITCPTQIIVGERDTATPIHEARIMFERIPGAKLAVLRNAAHLSNIEAAEEFDSTLIEFLKADSQLSSE